MRAERLTAENPAILKHQCCDHVPVTDARKGPPSRQAAPVGAGLQRGHEAAGVHQRAPGVQGDAGLRLVEVAKEDLGALPRVLDERAGDPSALIAHLRELAGARR